MGTTVTPGQIQQLRDLLREGRATEVDKLLNETQRDAQTALEAKQRKELETVPLTDAQLATAVYDEVSRLFGHPPRLEALIAELKSRVVAKPA